MNGSRDTNEYIREVLDRYSDMLIRIAYNNLKNQSDAEDIAQEAFLKLIKLRPGFESNEHEKAWLIRVTINLCKNHLKTAWFRKTVAINDNIYSFSKEENEILEVVMELPVKFRNVIYLHYYEDYSIKQIADILEKNENTICSWLFRARKVLKTKLMGGFEYE